MHETAHPRRLRLVVAACLAGLVLLVAVFVVVHTPPFRAFALRQATRAALNAGIRLEAERLDYSLASLRVGLAGVRVFAVGEREPFLAARRVDAQLSPGIFRRRVFFDDITITEGSIRIRRRADGTSNLPRTSGGGAEDPQAVPIGRLIASRLAVDYRDEQHDVAVQIPGLALELSREGHLATTEPMAVTIGSSVIRVTSIVGGLGFDGRDMTLSNVRVEMPEAHLALDGPLMLVRRQPSVDLQVSGDIEVEPAALWWGQVEDAPRGSVHVDGTMRGPLSSPLVDLQTGSTRLTWNGTDVEDLAARVRVDVDGLHVDDGAFGLAGGRLNGSLAVVWETGRAQVDATWKEIDAAGVVAMFGATTAVPVGRASGSLTTAGRVGRIEDWRGTGHLTLGAGRSGPNRISIPGDTRLAMAGGRWTLDARHLLGGTVPVSASLTGGLRGPAIADSTIRGEVRASESDLRVITQLLSDVGVSLAGAEDTVSGSVRADALVEGTLRRPVVRARVESDALTVAGQDVVDVKAQGTFAGSMLALDELSAQQPIGSGRGGPRGYLRASGSYDLTSQKYTARLQGGSWVVEPLPDVPFSGVIGLDYSGEGRGRLAFGTGRVTSSGTTWDGVGLGEITADVELKGDVAHVAARAADFDTAADATVTLRAPYAATVDARAPALDLARVAGKARLSTAVEGTADVHIRAAGDLERWRDGSGLAELVVRDARLENVAVAIPQPATVRYAARRLTIDRLDASVGQTSLAVSGTLPLSNPDPAAVTSDDDTIVALLTGDVNDVAVVANTVGAARRLPDAAFPGGQGPMTVLARIGGSLESPAITADLEVGPAVVLPGSRFAAIEDLRLRAHLENDLVELREAALLYRGARVNATGQAPLGLFTGAASGTSPGGGRIRATATGVTSAVMGPLVAAETLAQIGGSLDASLDLASPSLEIGDLTGELRLDRVELSVANVPIRQRVPTTVVAGGGLARIDTWEWEGTGTALKVSGQVHLSDRRAAILADGTIDARVLTPFLGDSGIATAGRLESRLSITGPVAELTINGDLRLADGQIRIREPRIIADEVNARAVLARGQVYLSDLRGVVNGGALTGTASLQYAPELRGRIAANVSGMALEFPAGLRTELDASLELTSNTGTQDAAAPRVTGLVLVKRGTYREPMALVTGLLANLRRPAVIGSTPPSRLDQIALDVRVATEDDLVIDNNVARAQLGADLRVINVAAAPALSGRAELREGGQLFLGRNTYTVQSGTIDFSNPTTIEPILGIEATTRVSRVDVTVTITGAPDSLMTTLTSNPSYDQADLTALLLTGRTLNQLSDQQAALVGAQVLGNLAGDVLGFAGRAVGLDTLRVGGVETTSTRDPADLASEVDPTSRLTFGKSLGSQLDLTLSQSLREGGEQTWIVDYLPVRRVALRFVSNDEELRSYEFRHDLTFGGPPAVRSADTSRVEAPRVSALVVTGDPGIPDARIRDRLRLREGDRFDFLEWQRDRDRIEELYHQERRLSARVGARRRETPEGVELTYDLEAGPETLETRHNDPPQVARNGWCQDYPDADNFLRVVMRSDSTNNDTRWGNPEFDKLVDEAAKETNQAKRKELYTQADKILVEEDAAITPIYWYTRVEVTKPYVTRTKSMTGHEAYEKWTLNK